MPKDRIILSVGPEERDLLNNESEKRGVTRNLLIVQIIRKHFKLPSLLTEGNRDA